MVMKLRLLFLVFFIVGGEIEEKNDGKLREKRISIILIGLREKIQFLINFLEM